MPVGTEECLLAKRQVWEASVGQAILLFVSTAAAGAGASFALRPGRPLSRAILPMLVVGVPWFIFCWIVFLVADLNHCPLGPF